MFRFTIREWTAVIGLAIVCVAIICAVATFGWWRNHPYSRTGSLRRGLEEVQ